MTSPSGVAKPKPLERTGGAFARSSFVHDSWPGSRSRTNKPFSVVVGNAIYKPDPDKNALSATKASMFDKRPGSNETSFCVDVDGKTVDVKTKKKFPNDPKVDEICRDTIKKWRFKPFIVGGKPVKTCSVAEFNFKFN